MRVTPNSGYVVACGGDGGDYHAVWSSAYRVALEALDVWSTRGIADLVIADPNDEHLTFWDDSSGSTLRIAGRVPLSMTISASLHVEGSPPPPPPTETWHESMRFYRLSQLSDDLHDSLRNLWLALENLLDDQVSRRSRGERERDWLKRCMKVADERLGLARYLPSTSSAATAKAPHNAACDYFYSSMRNDLFHAKASRNPKLPHDAAHAAELSEQHERLAHLYLDLVRDTLGVTGGAGHGGLTDDGFQHVLEGFEPNPRILLTNDPTPFDRGETSAATPGRQLAASNASRVPALEHSEVGVLLGRLDGKDAQRLGTITRVMLEVDGKLAVALLPEGQLRIRSVDHVEAQVGIVLLNRGISKVFPR